MVREELARETLPEGALMSAGWSGRVFEWTDMRLRMLCPLCGRGVRRWSGRPVRPGLVLYYSESTPDAF